MFLLLKLHSDFEYNKTFIIFITETDILNLSNIKIWKIDVTLKININKFSWFDNLDFYSRNIFSLACTLTSDRTLSSHDKRFLCLKNELHANPLANIMIHYGQGLFNSL